MTKRERRVKLGCLGFLGFGFGLSILAASCGGSSEAEKLDWPEPGPPLPFADHCQPLLAEVEPERTQPKSMCLLPFESDLATATIVSTDLKTESGHAIGPPIRPPAGLNVLHSMTPAIFATLPGDIVADGFPGELDDLALSTSTSAPIWIQENAPPRQTHVPYTAEIIDTGDGHKLIAAFPRRPLIHEQLVLLRGVRVASGGPARQPEGFRRLVLGMFGAAGDRNVCRACRSAAASGETDRRRLQVQPETCREQCIDDDPRLEKVREQLWMLDGKVVDIPGKKVIDPDVQLAWPVTPIDPAISTDGRWEGVLPRTDAPIRFDAPENTPSGARILRGVFAGKTVDRNGSVIDDALTDVALTVVIPRSVLTYPFSESRS